jgi:4-amino-4-deoxy-L-arabinose transferase-like glycosyltransferase
MSRKRKAAAQSLEQARPISEPPPYVLPAILIAGFLLRLFYLTQAKSDILTGHLVIDAQFYDQWAQRIAAGDWLGKTVFYQDPLYAYFLAFIYKAFGHSLGMVRLVQAALDAATAGLIYLLAKRLFNPLTGIVAAAMTALLSPLVYYVGLLDKTTLSVFLIAAALTLIVEAVAGESVPLYAAAGAAFGLAALARGNMLIVAAAVMLWLFSNRQASATLFLRLKKGICFGLAVFAVVGTIAARNYLVGRDLVLITANPGLNFFIGNNPYTIGQYIEPPFIRGIPEDEYNDAQSAAEHFTGKRFAKPSEVSRYWLGQGLKFIADEPGKWLILSGRKIFLAFHEFEIAETYSYDYFRGKYWALSLAFLTYGLIAPLGIVGALRSLRKDRSNVLHVFLAAYLLSLIAFFVTSRYRTPLVVGLIPFAAWLLVDLWSSPRTAGALLPPASALAVLLFLNHWRPTWFTVRVVESTLATAHTVAGALYNGTGDFENSVRELQAAVQANPAAPDSYAHLGEAYDDHGDVQAALTNYEQALRLNSGQDAVWEKVGVLNFKRKDYPRAEAAFQNALKLRPDEPVYRRNFDLTERALGRKK